ncbi:MAG: hypothetical protein U0793_20935 [Gemmataceae bacterium]
MPGSCSTLRQAATASITAAGLRQQGQEGPQDGPGGHAQRQNAHGERAKDQRPARLIQAKIGVRSGFATGGPVKFLHGPHIGLPWKVTRQSGQKPSPQSAQVFCLTRCS